MSKRGNKTALFLQEVKAFERSSDTYIRGGKSKVREKKTKNENKPITKKQTIPEDFKPQISFVPNTTLIRYSRVELLQYFVKIKNVYSSNADPSSSHPDPLRAGRSNLNSGILTPPFFATVGRVISMN